MNWSRVSIILFLTILSLGFLPGGLTSGESGQAEADTVSAPPAAVVGSGSVAPFRGASSLPTVVLRSASGTT